MEEEKKDFTVEELVEFVRTNGNSNEPKTRDEAMHNIYKMIMFKWKLSNDFQSIEDFLLNITPDIEKLHITVCLSILMATNSIKQKLQNRTEFYNRFKERIQKEYYSEEERKSILVSLL